MKINFFTYTYNILMVVKNQKNLMHDIVMNHIPKKKIEPPKISLEKMVKEHALMKQQLDTKILIENESLIQNNTSNLQNNNKLEKIISEKTIRTRKKNKNIN